MTYTLLYPFYGEGTKRSARLTKCVGGFVLWLALCWIAYAGLLANQAIGQEHPRFGRAWPNTDFSLRNIPLGDVLEGGPPKDGIPAIHKPKFVSPQKAKPWLQSHEPVLIVSHKGVVKGYPLQILIWHEIVNDNVAGLPVLVTFCPLCNSALVFDRRVKGKALTFGVSGLLRNSDMIMWDLQTESWWQQITGRGIVGHYTEATLTMLPSPITTFAFFAEHHPKGQILSRQTGFKRPYGENPYVGYDSLQNFLPFMLNKRPDPRLHPVERVLAVEVGKSARVYAYRTLEMHKVINDRLNKQGIALFFQPGATSALDKRSIAQSKKIGSAVAYVSKINGISLTFSARNGFWYDTRTDSKWSFLGEALAGPMKGKQLQKARYGTHFAFAWLAFYPESSVYKP